MKPTTAMLGASLAAIWLWQVHAIATGPLSPLPAVPEALSPCPEAAEALALAPSECDEVEDEL